MPRAASLPASLALVLCLLLAGPALAHGLNLFATPIGERIEGRAYFVGGTPAGNATIILRDAAGEIAGQTTSAPDTGTFGIVAPYRGDFVIEADAGDGHVATFPIPASRLPQTLAQAPGDPVPGPSDAQPDTASAAPSVTAETLETAIARQTAPLAAQIDALENRLWLRDIIGGIGYLLGIFGIWALWRVRGRT